MSVGKTTSSEKVYVTMSVGKTTVNALKETKQL